MRRLIIRPGAIGDCILSLPAMQHLASDYTEVWISSHSVPLIQFAGKVRSLASTGIDLMGVGDIEISDKLKAELASFDSIVSWYGANRPEFQDGLRSLGPACEFHRAVPSRDCPCHAVDFFAAHVGAPLGQKPRIDVKPSPSRGSVVIHPFSSHPVKTWPAERFRELAEKLCVEVEWTAGPEDEWPEAIRFDDLLQLARWMTGAHLYIGNDSGIAHLAAAAGVPTLVLFGPSRPDVWAPRAEHVTVVASPEEMAQISVGRVLETVNRLLGCP
jgi:lipopolysaccharide heptosyltransferase III